MPIIFFALGVVSVIALFFSVTGYMHRQFLKNPRPNYTAPRQILRGNFLRFGDSFEQLFPSAPAQSYVALNRYAPDPYKPQETKFFIRSVGKRDGVHRFQGELRLSATERHHVMDALPMLERIGGPIEREDKSYGLLVLKTSKLDSASDLIEIAHQFSQRVLGCDDTDPLSISWHFAGYHSAQKRAK